MAPKIKTPRPPKADLPKVKPAKTADQLNALWDAVAALSARVDRLEGDGDNLSTAAAALRTAIQGAKP